MIAPQLARAIAEHGPEAMDLLKAEHATITKRLVEIENWQAWLRHVIDRTQPMIPNPGVMDTEEEKP